MSHKFKAGWGKTEKAARAETFSGLDAFEDARDHVIAELERFAESEEVTDDGRSTNDADSAREAVEYFESAAIGEHVQTVAGWRYFIKPVR